MGKTCIRIVHVNIDVNDLLVMGAAGIVSYKIYKRHSNRDLSSETPVIVQVIDAVLQPLDSFVAGVFGK